MDNLVVFRRGTDFVGLADIRVFDGERLVRLKFREVVTLHDKSGPSQFSAPSRA